MSLLPAMDELNQLRHRIVELETELRLVKVQLSQSQQGTQYLINSLSSQHHHTENCFASARVATCCHQHPQIILTARNLETAHGQSTRHNCFTASDPSTAPTRAEQDPFAPSKPSFNNSAARRGTNQHQHEDLLTFEDDAASLSGETLVATSPDPDPSPNTRSSTSLIDISFDSPPTPFAHYVDDRDAQHPAEQAERDGLGISTSNENFQNWLPTCTAPPAKPRLIFSKRITDFEHNRMMGSAVFVEDMTPAEQAKHWENCGKQLSHSAEELKLYYDEVIRPAYLAKISAREIDEKKNEHAAENREHKYVEEANPDVTETSTGLDLKDSKCTPTVCHIQPLEEWFEGEFGRRDSKTDAAIVADSLCSVTLRTLEAGGLNSKESATGSSTVVKAEIPEYEVPDVYGFPTATQQDLQPARDRCTTSKLSDILEIGVKSVPAMPTPEAANQARSRMQDHIVERPRRRPFEHIIRFPGLFYKVTSTDSNLLRTVIISNIPPNLTFHEVLSKVCGGKIVSATFLGTATMKTRPRIDTNSVLVTFLWAKSAKKFVDYSKNNPVHFSDPDHCRVIQAEIKLIGTPTRPVHPEIFQEFAKGLTRVFYIVDDKGRLTIEGVIDEFARLGIKTPLKSEKDQHGIMSFEFAKASDAGFAWSQVDHCHWVFHGMEKGFLPDPCEVSLAQSDGENGTAGCNGGQDSNQKIEIEKIEE